jgi:hypothetical protein
MVISTLDKLIFEEYLIWYDRKSHYEFVEIDGINRILDALQKEVKANNEGFKTNFASQIDILRFLKSYSTRHSK